MSSDQVIRNDEKPFPIFYKKKVLSLENTKALVKIQKELIEDNEQTIANENLMLNKIRIKHNEFVARLEAHLERFKNAGAQEIILTNDMLPKWSQKNVPTKPSDDYDDQDDDYDDIPPELDDTVERINSWYGAMTTYVSLQRESVNQIVSDWFSIMDKIASEGETDPQSTVDDSKKSDDYTKSWKTAFWYIALMLICLVHMFIFCKPEDIDKCSDGFIKCFAQKMNFCVSLYNHYLMFHNITLDHQSVDLNISSTGMYQGMVAV